MTHEESKFGDEVPDGLIPTNFAGVYSVPAPPDDFDPNTASAAALIKNGIMWRRPQPNAHLALRSAWERVFSRRWLSRDRIVPVMKSVPGRTHRWRSRVPGRDNSTGGWSGCAVTGVPPINGALGFWFVPTVSVPSEPAGSDGGWDSSSWVGIDGYYESSSTDVVQAGVDQSVDSAGVATYTAWYEWWIPPPENPQGPTDSEGYPLSWVGPNGKYKYIHQANIANFPVTAGQQVMCSILYRPDKSGVDLAFANETTGQYFQILLKPPPQATFNGSSVEWIMELPQNTGETSSLPAFTPVAFGEAFATSPGCVEAILPTDGTILNIFIPGVEKQLTSASVNGTSVTIDFVG